MRRYLWLALLVAVLMLGGAVSLFLSHTSAEQARLVHLRQGWNLVAWTGANQPASGALAGPGNAVPAVYGYNNDSQSFTRYVLGRPEISTLTDFESEHAYWVLAQWPTDWSVPSGVGPSCPAATPCPVGTPCPSCPTPSLQSDLCTAYKVGIETDTILLDIAEKVGLTVSTPDEIRAHIQETQQKFNQQCQAVVLLQPSLLTYSCAIAGRWKGMQEEEMLFDPDPQTQTWENQFDGIVDKYCEPNY
jgi:hypothetical protein